MTYVRENSQGQKIYVADVPADIDYIKFSDGATTNERTDNIANGTFTDGTGFYLTEKGSKYWGVETYTYGEGGGSDVTETTANVPDTTAGGNQGGDTGSYTVYAINSAKWSQMAAHAWNDGGSAAADWPGTVMTKTSDKVNGYDVYSVTFSKEYTNVIFNNNKKEGASQTSDLTFETGKYFDVKTEKWYKSLSEVPEEDANLASSTYYLRGTLTDWGSGKLMTMGADGSSSITLTVSAGTHTFKIYDSATEKWYGNGGTIETTAEGWTFTDSAGDCTLISSGGTYTFKCYMSGEKFKVDVTK